MFVEVSSSLFPVRAPPLEILQKTNVLVIDYFFLDNLGLFNNMLTSIYLLYLVASGNGGCDDRKNNERKKGFWNAFISFLAMGGFLVVLVVGVVIAILISTVTQ